MDLQGKMVLVTGASSGIGKAIAIAFAQKRAHVLVHYGRNKVGAQDTLREIEKNSSGRLYQADLMDPGAVKSLFDDIKRATATLDVLVNNAGEARSGELNEDTIWEYEYKNVQSSGGECYRHAEQIGRAANSGQCGRARLHRYPGLGGRPTREPRLDGGTSLKGIA